MIDTIDHEPGIRELRLSRPPVNALDLDMLAAIGSKISAAARDSAAVIITGKPGIFSAGLDVPAMLLLDRAAIVETFIELWRAQHAIASSPVPVVFGLTGHCPAGGTVLAIHGDYRVMARGDFRLGLNEVQVGLFPGPVIHGAFARLTGGHAAQLLTRGALVDPDTALRVGLVDELSDLAEVPERALSMAREFVRLPREPMSRTRELARRNLLALFGPAGDAEAQQREFGDMAAEMWFVPAIQDMLRKMFARRKG